MFVKGRMRSVPINYTIASIGPQQPQWCQLQPVFAHTTPRPLSGSLSRILIEPHSCLVSRVPSPNLRVSTVKHKLSVEFLVEVMRQLHVLLTPSRVEFGIAPTSDTVFTLFATESIMHAGGVIFVIFVRMVARSWTRPKAARRIGVSALCYTLSSLCSL